jgi:hypothetical protein
MDARAHYSPVLEHEVAIEVVRPDLLAIVSASSERIACLALATVHEGDWP